MNIQQFQYILAVAEHRHFEQAAEKCFISQSTLSTMISKFEEEVGLRIFDRSKKPVQLTMEGNRLIEQLKIITYEIEQLHELTKEIKGEISGEISLSVIPTVAPFLLPLFLNDFAQSYPKLRIQVREETTSEIMRKLKSRELDIGIVSIPLLEKDLKEIQLYDEPFLFFNAAQFVKKNITVKQVRTENLCLMEEGHCMRTQVQQLCRQNRNMHQMFLNIEYKAGSIDSLIRIVKANKGSTLIPYLAGIDFTAKEQKHVSVFTAPIPYRTIGLVVHQHFVKQQLLQVLQKAIIQKVGEVLPRISGKSQMLKPIVA